MSIIKNIDLIKGLLSESQLEKLEKHAFYFEDRSKIQFNILEVTDESITVSASQGKASRAFVAAPRELAIVAKSVFGLYVPDRQILTKIDQYVETAGASSKPSWNRQAQKSKGVAERKAQSAASTKNRISIGNRHLIERFLRPERLQKMESHANFFEDRSQIHFKVLEVREPDILVNVQQIDPKPGNVVRPQELETICKSFFEFYLEDKRIHLNEESFNPTIKPPANAAAILQTIKDRGITAEQIAEETGLSIVTLNAWFDGRQGMSTLARAMFHYMLK